MHLTGVPPMRADLHQRFVDLLGSAGVLTGHDVSDRNAGIWRQDRIQAWAILRPRETRHVAAILAWCHAEGQAVVPHGGLTGLVGGADTSPDDIVISLELMRAIEAVDTIGRTATAQAGVTVQELQEAASDHGLSFPLDLGARGTATLGGVISTNAGGNRVIRYGMTRDMVLGLEVVLADGTVLSSLNRLIKNNAGYDLKHLFVGAEGTLGVVTRAVVRLREKPGSEQVALLAAPSFAAVVALLKHVDRASGGMLSAFEVMWHDHYAAVADAPGGAGPPIALGHPFYVLLEAQGGDPAADRDRFQGVLEGAVQDGLILDAAIADSQSERRALWAVRDNVAALFRFGDLVTFDVSLPIAEMEAYTAEVHAGLLARYPDGHVSIFGHLGDGNLHVVVAPRTDVGAARATIERVVYEPLRRISGSISAEHGIGLEKKRYLDISRCGEEIDLMRRLREALDPRGILNRGKIVDSAPSRST
jgi:FAD/FMN-containing dehydrogenase